MKKNSPPYKHALYAKTKEMRILLEKAKHLAALNDLVSSHLPAHCRGNCCVANYRQGILVLSVSSGVWASQLRFILPELLSTLRAQAAIPALRSITLKIHPRGQKSHEKPYHKPLYPKVQTRQLITDMASTIDNERLAKAMRKLASRKIPEEG